MKKVVFLCALGIAALAAGSARADEFSFSFNGPNVDHNNQFSFSGSGTLYADYSGVGNIWTINSIAGTVTTATYVNHTTTDFTDYTIGSLLPVPPDPQSYDNNDNLLYWPGGLSLSGADFFDSNGVSFSLVGTSADVNLDTGYFWVFGLPVPYDQANGGSYSEGISETVCWQAPGDPSPTPEPGSLALLGTSILGGAGLLRRRFKFKA